jgi:hypothetical protein
MAQVYLSTSLISYLSHIGVIYGGKCTEPK